MFAVVAEKPASIQPATKSSAKFILVKKRKRDTDGIDRMDIQNREACDWVDEERKQSTETKAVKKETEG